MGDFCRQCGEYTLSRHECPPMWIAWSPDYGESEEDGRRVFAQVAYAAAERFAEQFDAGGGDYTIVRGNDATVMVRLAEGGPVHEFVVSGESVPSYSAREITLEANGGT